MRDVGAIICLALVGAVVAIGACPRALADTTLVCSDGDVLVTVTPSKDVDGNLLYGQVDMNATDGGDGFKQAAFNWRNLTAGSMGTGRGNGRGTGGAFAPNVRVGVGEIEMSTVFTGHSGIPSRTDGNAGNCVGSFTVT
ncbi:hypothetical protein ABQF35_05190 [Mycobacterium syngnathidarum]